MTAYVIAVTTTQSRIVESFNIDEAAREARMWAEGLKGNVLEVRRADLDTSIAPSLTARPQAA